MKLQDISTASNPDLRASLAALRRASALARKIAIDTDTGIVVVREGRTVYVPAKTLRRDAATQQDATRD
jgi:hypothetical protein